MKYIQRRVLATIPVVFGVCCVTFLLMHAIPGDPVDVMLGELASPQEKQELRQHLNLDQSMISQLFGYFFKLLKFNLGESLVHKTSVTQLILERIPATLELTVASLGLALLVSLPLGVWSAVQKFRWPDTITLILSFLFLSLPAVFLGPVLVWIFALKLDLFPVSDRGGLQNLFLPALSLALPLSAVLMRMTRTSMLEVLSENFIVVAKAKGVRPWQLYGKHALRNALIPVITVFGLQVGAVLTGTVITETIFDWPGMGTLLYDAIQNRDYPVIQGCTLVIAFTYVFVHLITDLAYAWAQPQVRDDYEC